MSVGNDVVDLGDPETQPERLHPRFDARVFGPDEQEALRAAGSPPRLRWALWAAKESAYKACARLEPGLAFRPKQFEVVFDAATAGAAGRVGGTVRHRGQTFAVEVWRTPECLHAVATTGDPAARELVSRVGITGTDPSAAVRRLAASVIGPTVGRDPIRLRIVGRPPVATYAGRCLDIDLSLSHHGRFVAVAGVLPGAAARP